jgi:tetratricopeptide (TPR) repeat protein
MDSLEDKAEEAEERGDFVSAFQLWTKLAQRDRDPVFFTRCGRVAEKLGKWDDAEDDYAEALRLDPDFTIAMESMGNLWAKRTDKNERESFETAKGWFLKALRRERSGRTLTFLGATYRALGDRNAARDALAEALRLDPDNAEALYNLALADAEEDRQKSIELMEKAVDIDPLYFAAHQNLGKLHHGAGDLLRAEYHFRRSLEIEPTDFWSLLYLANVLAVQKKTEEAEQTYRLATSLHPSNKDGVEFFARFLESIGKTSEAAAMRSGGPETGS